MLLHVKVPDAVSSYINDLYSKLSAYVTTKSWSTPSFSIQKGVFQGDTLSPILFLLCFNPIIQSAQDLPSLGVHTLMELPNSVVLPAINTYIYVEWDEVTSEEPCGWYHCCVQEYQFDGNVIMK